MLVIFCWVWYHLFWSYLFNDWCIFNYNFHLFYIWLSINSWNFQTSELFGCHSCCFMNCFCSTKDCCQYVSFGYLFLLFSTHLLPFLFKQIILVSGWCIFLFGCYFRFEFEYWNAMLEVFNIISRDHFHQYMERVDLLWISIERNLWV